MTVNPKGKKSVGDNDESLERRDSTDQVPATEGSYYYDDAHGYEVFDPEAPDSDEEPEESEPSLPSDRC